jgi:hypothetical protein
MQQRIVALVSPRPDFRVRSIPASDGEGHYLLMAVLRSPSAPLAVRVKDALRYPVRSGSHTRYPCESEIADLYRRRFTAAEERGRRLDSVQSNGAARLPGDDRAWLTVSLVPELEGRVTMSRGELDRIRAWLDDWRAREPFPGSMLTTTTTYVEPSLSRFQCSDRDEGHVSYFLAQLYFDGSGFAAVALADRPGRDYAPLPVEDEIIAGEVITLLRLLAGHAMRSGAGAEARVRVALQPLQLAEAEGRPDRLSLFRSDGRWSRASSTEHA